MKSEGGIVYESETCRYVHAFHGIPLILSIYGCRPVVCRSIIYSHRSLEIVVSIFCTYIERVCLGEIEYTLQCCHISLLITLKILLIGEVWIVVGKFTFVISIFEGGICVEIIVCVLFPTQIHIDIIFLAEHHLTAEGSTRIAILQVVGIYIARSVTAVGRA